MAFFKNAFVRMRKLLADILFAQFISSFKEAGENEIAGKLVEQRYGEKVK